MIRCISIRRVGRMVTFSFVGLTGSYSAAHGAEPGAGDPTTALSNVRLYVEAGSLAAKQADAWGKSRPADAALMRYIAGQPTAKWFGGWNSDIARDVRDATSRAAAQGAAAVLVAYNIPHRDCGSYSAGGAGDAQKYGAWIRSFADGVRGRTAIVILEPDAVAGSECLSASGREERFAMLKNAVRTLKSAGAFVYLDAGNAHWVKADVIADRLHKSGIDQADGFSLNVSNYFLTSDNISFGTELSRLVGGKHFVIDTSRNGNGGTSKAQWCNPSGQALGSAPTTRTNNPLVDALLWIKQPGESDGTCNGGPQAGTWWAEFAVGLASRSNNRTVAMNN